jgi:hypothetical protein
MWPVSWAFEGDGARRIRTADLLGAIRAPDPLSRKLETGGLQDKYDLEAGDVRGNRGCICADIRADMRRFGHEMASSAQTGRPRFEFVVSRAARSRTQPCASTSSSGSKAHGRSLPSAVWRSRLQRPARRRRDSRQHCRLEERSVRRPADVRLAFTSRAPWVRTRRLAPPARGRSGSARADEPGRLRAPAAAVPPRCGRGGGGAGGSS